QDVSLHAACNPRPPGRNAAHQSLLQAVQTPYDAVDSPKVSPSPLQISGQAQSSAEYLHFLLPLSKRHLASSAVKSPLIRGDRDKTGAPALYLLSTAQFRKFQQPVSWKFILFSIAMLSSRDNSQCVNAGAS